MTLELWLTAAAIGALLALSGFFSGSETALTAASEARMHALERDGEKRAMAVSALLLDRERLIGAILLGNNLVNILASALATNAFVHVFGDAGVFYATLIMTALVLVFAEVLPKTYAIGDPDDAALRVARPIRILVSSLAPVVATIRWIVDLTLRLTGLRDASRQTVQPHDEIRGAIDYHHKEGAVGKYERDRLAGLLDLRDVEVSEIMVHRKNIVMLDLNQEPSALVAQVLDSPYTRMPLFRDDPENIVGVLHTKDVLRAYHAADGAIATLDLEAIAREPWFTPETTALTAQLNAFLKRRSHFALVVDEYGALMGLVTLEDILEEIFGDIEDEHDIANESVARLPGGGVEVEGQMSIRDLNRALDWGLPDSEAVTVAGLVIHEAQTIPTPGQAFQFHGFRFEVLARRRNQIMRVRVSPLPNDMS